MWGIIYSLYLKFTNWYWGLGDTYGPPYGKNYKTFANNTAIYKPKVYSNSQPSLFGYTTKANGLKWDEREKPPRASFFGRINGEYIEGEGNLEERWLSFFELSVWKKQKEN